MPDAEIDREVRIAIARSIRTRGRIPKIADVASEMAIAGATVDASFARMIEGHVFVPQKGSHEIYAYDPFCVGPTDFFVTAADRVWFAICAWDALGIPAALGSDGVIETHCGDCNEPIVVRVDADGVADVRDWTVMQIGVAPRDFWKDIYYT
ncbi:MAG TPA: organomercurial lyase [Candidatus Limnocylindria bacterium]|nr:organomercurial lyase [Candidatus Limnocylindria bacterium]